jgi:hypothetical protein
MQLELIGEVFNLFNSSNWLTNNFTYVYDDFGLNNLPGDPRIFQIGAKFRF